MKNESIYMGRSWPSLCVLERNVFSYFKWLCSIVTLACLQI